MNNNYINNDADFSRFVNSTLNYDDNNNNIRSTNQDKYKTQITNILENRMTQLKFSRLFAHYFINRAFTNDYSYSSQCCICMDTNNYCIKICDCVDVKYCYKCFKEYVKTSILGDPIKINSAINCWNYEQNINLTELISCSICHKTQVLGLIEQIIDNIPRTANTTSGIHNSQEIGDYLLSLDFFTETVPHQGAFKWYILFNQDGRIRYTLVPIERINELNNCNNNTNNTARDINNTNNNSNQHLEDDETRLRKAGFIHIFEITRPSPAEHQQIKRILNQAENQPTQKIRLALQRFNPSRLKLL